MHVLAKLPGGSLVQRVGLRYCVEPPGNGRYVGYRKRLLACEILSSFFEVGGTIQETEYTSIQRSALQKGRIHVFMFQGSQKNLRWHFSYKTKNKTMLMFVRMIFLHSLKFIMVGITIQILSLNNSTPFSYFFEVSLILNKSMQRTLSSLTTSLITFFN